MRAAMLAVRAADDGDAGARGGGGDAAYGGRRMAAMAASVLQCGGVGVASAAMHAAQYGGVAARALPMSAARWRRRQMQCCCNARARAVHASMSAQCGVARVDGARSARAAGGRWVTA